MTGSVFVVRGDLTKLACDAWLVPSDGQRNVDRGWQIGAPDKVRQGRGVPYPDELLGEAMGLAREVRGWHVGPAGHRRCQAWLTDVVADNHTDQPWDRPLRDFARAARRDASELGRSRPLLAVPVIGTRLASTPRSHGEICEGILTSLRRLAVELDVDLALVANDGHRYSAAQAVRRRDQSLPWWPELTADPRLREKADGLVKHAVNGDLVLFLGAGTSRRAGAPSWSDLLRHLAEGAGMTSDEASALVASNLGNLEKAAVIDAYLAAQGDDPLVRRNSLLERHMPADHYSLSHGLLAALPVREVATTNYDQLFEMASRSAGIEPAIVPYQPVGRSRRWLLKLHGSVEKNDLVLSRNDYLRNAQRGAALAGLVQALLITKRLCFVGYSLDDESFHRIAFEVRQALHDSDRDGAQFGTALMVGLDHQLASIWRRDIDMIDLGTGPAGGDLLEVLVDYIACHATSAAPHLFNDELGDILMPAEVALRDGLAKMVEGIDLSALDEGVRKPLEALLSSYGYEQV